jgi:multiple sugar transport system ATP-binding protein
MAEIELKEIWKSFDGKTHVLKGVSFSVKDGEFLSLLGPSGCGKTTLLRIVAGLEYADRGEILIDGKNVSKLHASKRDVAMVFQNYALYPHMNVLKNITISLRLRKMSSFHIKERLQNVAKLLEIEELLERLPRSLSGGQRQRVALARAIIRNPKVFLLDEPLSNLDAVLREKTRSELKMLFTRIAGTVIYVTHDQIEAMTLSDRIVILNEGKIQQIGTPYEIYSKPANTFVASFVGVPSMNLIEGEFDGLRFFSPAFCIELKSPEVKELSQENKIKVILGIRPESLKILKMPLDRAIKGKLCLIESLGTYKVATVQVGKVMLKSITEESQLQIGSEVWLLPDLKMVHLFDLEGKRLTFLR